MSREPVFVTVHIHTDGPIPGPHSLLILTSAAQPRAGGPISTFAANVRELPGATLHPTALHRWRRRPEEWLASRRASRPPAAAMAGYLRWLERLSGQPVLVFDPEQPEQLFLYWYLHRFTGGWPFTGTRTEPDAAGWSASQAVCPLVGCRGNPVPLARSS